MAAASMPGAPRQLTAEDLANLSNSNHHHRGINSDAAKAQREKHLTATFTTRDIFGICRGACTSCDTRGCPGGYLKATRDYGKDALEEARSRGDTRHPYNKPEITNCARCGCESSHHEVDEGTDARERGNDSFAEGDYRAALIAYSKGISVAPGDARGWCNRAAVCLKMNNPPGALSDAERAVQIEPEWAKARARVGEAHLALGRHEDATRAFKVALKLEPGNKSYTDALARVELDKKASDKKAAVDKKVTASGRKVPNPPGVNQPPPAASTPPSRPPHTAPSRTAVSAPHSAPHSAPPKAPPLGAACEQLRISVGEFQTAYEQTVSETDALRAEATSLGTRMATLEARESALEGRVRDLHAELESVRREVTVATRERDFAREESARTREAMDELETKKSTGDGSGDNKCASDEDDDEGDGRDEKEAGLPEKTPHELGKVGEIPKEEPPEGEVGGISEKSEPPSTEKAELSESLRFFEQFQSSSSSSETVEQGAASTRQSGRRSPSNGFCFLDSDSDSDTDSNCDSDRTRNKSSSSTSEAPFDDSGFIKPQSIKPSVDDEEWAERWEREQWERKHRGVGSYERQSVDRKVNTVDRFDSEFGATEDTYATGKQSGGTVFGVDALADLLGATTEDQMGSRDLNGVARGPCRTTSGKKTCFAFVSIADWDGDGVTSNKGPPLPFLLPEHNKGVDIMSTYPGVESVKAYEDKVRELRQCSQDSSSTQLCARCGCGYEAHMTTRELLRRRREEKASRDARSSEESLRLKRVAASEARIRRAKRDDAFLERTHLDCFGQAERGGCAKCGPKVCDKFTVIHTCADTHDPEVMAYCSICGCKYDSHPTTAKWRQEKEAGERADRARYERMRAAQDAQDAARFETSALEANNKWETKMYAALGIDDSRNGISRKELDRAYRKCALRWHPDKFHGNTSDGEKREATRRFVEAADAYRRLTTSDGI